MGILNWAVAKLAGAPTVSEYCRDHVVEVLTKNNIERYSFDFLKGERSLDDGRFHVRIYFGTGYRNNERVSFVLKVDESLPYPWGALVKSADKDRILQLRQEWSNSDSAVQIFGLYSFVASRLGELEMLV